MWFNSRMDTMHTRARFRSPVQWFLPVERAYMVRWLDDDAGWRSMTVIACSAEEAIATVQPIAGRPDLKAYRCVL